MLVSAALLLLASSCALAVVPAPHKRAAADYAATEGPIALGGLFANIGANGAKDEGATAGVVVAAPSTDPNYIYTWTRDSALTFKTIIDRFTAGRDTNTSSLIQQYVSAQAVLQNTPNPSGAANTTGLGEPKFNIDLTAFTGAWGRPQRDGPALRTTALITYANYLLAQGNPSYVTTTLFPIITLDLNYVAAYWNLSTFDLWEEINSMSFFTTAVQHRAMREGIALAQALGSTANVASWETQADAILCSLQTFWNDAYLTANTGGGRSGLDANTLLGSIHTFSANAGCDATTFQPCSDKALANHFAVVNSFRGSLYPINAALASNAAVAVGRYKEDVYQGGNPWYLCTLAAAEQLYLALNTWTAQGSITVTATSQPFFAQFSSAIAAGTYPSTSATYAALISAISAYADGFVALVQTYTPPGGALAEQFARSGGAPLSAPDLTWSYASALTAFDARAGTLPAPWPAAGLSTTCTGTGTGGAGTSTIVFVVTATTVFGENIYLTGSIDALRDWSTTDPIGPLSNPNYPQWTVTVQVPANTAIEYKYLRIDGSSVTWESDPNLSITSAPAGQTITTNDTWR